MSQHSPSSALESATPLKQKLADESAAARKDLKQHEFSRSDYQRLLDLCERTIAQLEKQGIEAGAGGRLARHRRVLSDLIASMENADADVVRPSDSEVYLTGLELGQLSYVVAGLVQSSGHWNQRVAELVLSDGGLPAGAMGDRRFKLQFAAMSRLAGVRTVPPQGGAQCDCFVESDRWRFGVVAHVLSVDADTDAAIQLCSQRFRADRTPGLMVLEITNLVWPERKVIRVASDTVAAAELQRRADSFLASHRQRIAAGVDPVHAFGLLVVATLPTYNVATRHVAFSTSFRIASLCPEGDPRLERLAAFARQFQRLGG